jgi:hypothetical protein
MNGDPIRDSDCIALKVLEGIRRDVLGRIQNLTEAEAHNIPPDSRNSIHWNIGHILHVQLAHWYVRRGLALPVDPGFRTYFREGKSPADYDGDAPTFAALLDIYREYSLELPRNFGGLLREALTQPFDYLNTRYATIADDLHLLIFHEGEHFPKLNRLLKALGK